ncbi:ABC transporter permease [Streptomyces sp. NPDC126499]|uniref:ABC transporter permease n=1 Tax=Streptomyces sp. NPDC126499 TaxID=3155314 RepID=UPI0033267F51
MSALSSLTPKGSYWVTVRQYRRTLWLTAAAVVLALAVIGSLRIWDAGTPDSYVHQGEQVPANDTGYALLRIAMEYGGGVLILLPLLVAAFVAGPLVAREYESGTYRLSLTQSVSPVVWLRTKLLAATAAAFLTALALMGVFRIGWVRISAPGATAWDPGPYAATGIVLFAYLLAAVAVGALVGQLIRRTLLAMAATGLVLGVVLLVLGTLRWSFLTAERIIGPASAGTPLWPSENGLVMEEGLLTAAGERFDQGICWREVDRTPGLDADPTLWEKVFDQCLDRNGITTRFVDYHPPAHFWPTQLLESGIVLALAALALVAAFRVLRARHP